jgi:hypothetical protein
MRVLSDKLKTNLRQMKTLKNVTLLAVIALGMVLFACQKEDVKTTETEDGISKEVKRKLISLGVNPYGAYKEFIKYEDGTGEDVYIAENDLMVPVERLNRVKPKEGTNAEEYVGGLLDVGASRTIVVAASSNLNYMTKNALRDAVSEISSTIFGTKIDVSYSYSSNQNDADIYVSYATSGVGSTGILSGLPQNGDPYDNILIGSNFHNNGSYQQRIFMHNILHCLGLHHNDAQSMQSCPGYPGFDYSDMPSFPSLYVPGTPSGYYSSTAIMNVCYDPYAPVNYGLEYIDDFFQFFYYQ